MADILDQIKQVGALIGEGLVKEMAPQIASGFINQLFHRWNVNVGKIIQDVQNNRSLWQGVTSDLQRQVGDMVRKVGNVDFITSDFIITSIKKDFPGVASLFLNWPEAAEWLDRQVNDLKARLTV